MLTQIKIIGALLKRDLRILITYKFAFTTMLFSIGISLFYLVLFGAMFGVEIPVPIAEYGMDFVSYLLIGAVGWAFLWSVLNVTAQSTRNEMLMGTLEPLLLTKVKLPTLMIAYTIFGSLFGLASLSLLLLVGYFAFGVAAFAAANVFTLTIFILSALLVGAIGFIFAGVTFWVKNIGAGVPVLQNIAIFFSGVFFPITMLPEVLQPISKFVPFYYSIEGMRKSLLPTVSATEMVNYVGILLVFVVLFAALGLYILHRGLIKAKKGGTLAYY